jgi:flavin reductase (DIM6/NTAB) family NADH-FMN oxidoreductase RutF
MDFDLGELPSNLCYKLLVALVVPRPIALVSTLGTGGVVNAAPFSFFNLMGDDPPVVILSIENRSDGAAKDTARNIVETQEFVVNLVDEDTAERMHACSQDFPSQVSEPEQVGLAMAASSRVRPPRIADSPASLECRLIHQLRLNERRLLVLGQVVWVHCRDGIVDPQTLRVNADRYFPVGRLFADRYVTTRDQFQAGGGSAYLESVRRLGRL